MVDSVPIQGSGRKLFYGLFIFPLLIAVGMAVLLCTMVLMTREAETPESLITAIKTGSPSKRWQKAYELSNELNQGRGMIRSSGVMKEIIHILKTREQYDAKTRSYMVAALVHFEEPEVAQVLKETLASETEMEVQLFLMWALGVKGVKEAEAEIQPFLKDERPDLRKMAAYVLGVLGSSQSVAPLTLLIEDGVRDVRWNAALSLARLGSDAGYGELLKMIDRASIQSDSELAEAKIEAFIVSAVKGIALLGRSDARPYLEALANFDESLKVRQAALEASESLRKGQELLAA